MSYADAVVDISMDITISIEIPITRLVMKHLTETKMDYPQKVYLKFAGSLPRPE